MTNGEKIKELYPRTPMGVRLDVDGTNGTMTFTTNKDCWNAEYKEPVIRDNGVKDELAKNDPIDYCRAFKIACELLNGSVLYGVDADRIYEIMIAKDGVVSSDSYESYILNNLQELDRGQYASEPTTKKDLGVDCISRADARKAIIDHQYSDSFCKEHNIDHSINTGMALIALSDLPPVTPQEPRKGHWVKTPKAVMGEGYMWYCDKCNYEVYQDTSRNYPSEKFCPNCGSDNREVEE